jgi:hypothetical protein
VVAVVDGGIARLTGSELPLNRGVAGDGQQRGFAVRCEALEGRQALARLGGVVYDSPSGDVLLQARQRCRGLLLNDLAGDGFERRREPVAAPHVGRKRQADLFEQLFRPERDAGGGVIAQWVLPRVSDRTGRRSTTTHQCEQAYSQSATVHEMRVSKKNAQTSAAKTSHS